MLGLATVLLFSDPTAAQSGRRWVVAGDLASEPLQRRLSTLLRERLGTGVGIGIDTAPPVATPDELRKIITGADVRETMFVVTDGAFFEEAVSLIGAATLEKRGFELATPRLWGRTLYVFAAPGLDTQAPLRGYVRWAGIQQGDMRDHAASVVKRVNNLNVRFTAMNFAETMAQDLRGSAKGGVDIVCIYEEEPSSFLVRFVEELRARGSSARLLLATQESSALATTDGVPTLTMPYDEQRFYTFPNNVAMPDGGKGSVVVTPPPVAPTRGAIRLPLILTNARRTGDLPKIESALGKTFPQLVNHAYLRALFETGMSRCHDDDPVSADQFKSVLLSTFFSDRDDPYMGLSLLGHLDFSRTQIRAERDTPYSSVTVFESIFKEQHELTSTTAQALIAWLRSHPVNGKRIEQTNLRARFANYPDAQIYTEAIRTLHAAVVEPRLERRQQMLEDTRATLVALAEVKRPAACGTRDPERGLWTGIDFEPFFYLAVIDAVLRDMGPVK